MKKFCFIVVLSSCSIVALSQTDSVWSKRKSVVGYYSEGAVTSNNFSALNTIITDLGYPSLANDFGEVSFGISKRERLKTSYWAFKASFLFSQPRGLNAIYTKDVRLRGWSVSWSFQPNLVNHPKWLIYPYFGIGLGLSNLTLFDNINYQSFAGSAANLSSPVSKTWSSFAFKYEVGLGVERKIRVWIYDFYTGVNAGYSLRDNNRFTDDYGSWKNTPPISLNGWTVGFRLRFELTRLPIIKNAKSKK